MKVIRTIAELRSELKDRRESGSGPVGLVPTMGYLHEGHASLMRKAREMAGTVVVSIFVNPIQFGPGEDYETYPRGEARDLALAESEGVNVVLFQRFRKCIPSRPKRRLPYRTLRHCCAGPPSGILTVLPRLLINCLIS